mmetsp:Transcript_122998/g.244794  ORF Transcript_122998/g.244794 Transcript_122998/m.244794 type:complete len:347 (-) Transcript_122998:11-1051(-)
MLAALGKNLECMKVHGSIPALGNITTAAVVVLYEVDRIPANIKLCNDILYLAVKHLPQPKAWVPRGSCRRQWVLCSLRCSAEALLHAVDPCQNYLRMLVALCFGHLDDLTVEACLLLTVRNLLHGPIEDEEDRMRFRLDAISADEDLWWEELGVLAPEFPKQSCIPVVPLLHQDVVLDTAVKHYTKLLLLALIHPNLTTCIVAHDGRGRCIASVVHCGRLDHRRYILQGALIHCRVLDNDPLSKVRRYLLCLVESHVESPDEAALAAATGTKDQNVCMGWQRCLRQRCCRVILCPRCRANPEPTQRLPHVLNLALHDCYHGRGHCATRALTLHCCCGCSRHGRPNS